MGKFIHHHSAQPEFGAEGDSFDVIETDDGISIWHRSMEIESDYENQDFAMERADELADEFDLRANNNTYRGHNIERLYPSGYWESYIGGSFHKADTLAGIKAVIDEHLD